MDERGRPGKRSVNEAVKRARVVVENISPRVDGGSFAVKRTIGQTVAVQADAFTDGHEVLAVELLWKAADEKDWRTVAMVSLGNDRWTASFTPTRIGRHSFTVEAWRDDFGTLCRDIALKHDAGVDIRLEIREAREYLARVASATQSGGTLAAIMSGARS